MNWAPVRDEAVSYLCDLLRINTVNPPGNELRACEYLAGVLAREGIETTLLEAAPGRGNLVARLRGNGRAAPLLLMAHVDVVPVESARWKHDPFGAEIRDGYLYGRGALDTKDLVAMELTVMLWLKRNQAPLARDVIFMANADEEAGGQFGAGWMVREHPDLIRAEYALNEGGGFGTTILGKHIYTVQTGEKGTARFTLRAHGKPGHASIPQRESAVLKLARGLEKLGDAAFPMHLTATARNYIEGLAKAFGGHAGTALRGLLDGKNGKRALENLPLDEGMRGTLYAMLHNTATPTKLSAGNKINVIPSVAEAQVDGRLVPGQTAETFLHELRAVLGPEYEIEFHQPTTRGIEADPQSPLYDAILRSMKRHDPAAIVIPDLVVGATDARHVTKLGTKVYGFCPMFDDASEMERVHGDDERIALENVGFGTRVLYEVVSEFSSHT
ncbi:MAG: M20/M25/M40 family metallo-hydrolase [Chloroflexi bacterium]|nr:M20/M25/M40 family metallo-hydrolase [Chloroflexota bacterium]